MVVVKEYKYFILKIMMNNFYVYILKCSDDFYYVGHTDDIEKRILEYHSNKFHLMIMVLKIRWHRFFSHAPFDAFYCVLLRRILRASGGRKFSGE